MAITATERVWHTIIYGGLRKTGLSANLTLRIVRSSDGYLFDWNDRTFKASGWTTKNQAATEADSTNAPGLYYWTIGTGASVDHILPEVFIDDEYIFEVEESTLPYHCSEGLFIRKRRLPDVLTAMLAQKDKVLTEGSVGNYIVYEDDGETALLTKNVKDKDGGAITLAAGVPAQEEEA